MFFFRTVKMAALVVRLAIVVVALLLRSVAANTRKLNVTSHCENLTLLQVTAAEENSTAADAHIMFLFSTVGAPGILLSYSSRPISVSVKCPFLILGLNSAVEIDEDIFTGVSIVFESVIEFIHGEPFEDKVSFDGLNANEYDPAQDLLVQEVMLNTLKWTQPTIRVENDFSYIYLSTTDGTIDIELYNTGKMVNTLLGVLTPEATKLRMELRNFPFLQPDQSRVAFKISISAQRGNACPEFDYVATPSDVTFSRLFTRLVASVKNVFDSSDESGNNNEVLGHVGWPPLARMEDPGTAVPMVYSLAQQAKDAANILFSDPVVGSLEIGTGSPTDAAPAVVNVTRLALANSQVLYTQVPYSVLKSTLNLRSVSCIKRAFVTVEGPVGDYISWEPEIGAGAPSLPGVPFVAELVAILCCAVPAALAMLLGLVFLIRRQYVSSNHSHSQLRYPRHETNSTRYKW